MLLLDTGVVSAFLLFDPLSRKPPNAIVGVVSGAPVSGCAPRTSALHLPSCCLMARSRSLCPPPQVVKVVGSNISHKLRLSRVKPTDEGTYECRVIDFSDGKARHHKVKAYLRVQPGENSVLHLPEAPPAAPAPPPPKPGKELRKRSVDEEACSL